MFNGGNLGKWNFAAGQARADKIAALEVAKDETRNALQTMYDATNHGQQKQIVKDEAVKTLFDLYGVEYSE